MSRFYVAGSTWNIFSYSRRYFIMTFFLIFMIHIFLRWKHAMEEFLCVFHRFFYHMNEFKLFNWVSSFKVQFDTKLQAFSPDSRKNLLRRCNERLSYCSFHEISFSKVFACFFVQSDLKQRLHEWNQKWSWVENLGWKKKVFTYKIEKFPWKLEIVFT